MPKFGENMKKEQSVAGYRRLNKKQQEFLNNYVHKDMTQTASAREAGYSNPTVDAVRLLRIVAVQERLDEMRGELESKFGVTVAKSVRDLQRIRDKALDVGKFGDAIRAEELRLKATGLLVNKTHVKHENVDAMSREQILEKLGDFMKIAQSRMKDVTPDPDNPKKIVDNSENMVIPAE